MRCVSQWKQCWAQLKMVRDSSVSLRVRARVREQPGNGILDYLSSPLGIRRTSSPDITWEGMQGRMEGMDTCPARTNELPIADGTHSPASCSKSWASMKTLLPLSRAVPLYYPGCIQGRHGRTAVEVVRSPQRTLLCPKLCGHEVVDQAMVQRLCI